MDKNRAQSDLSLDLPDKVLLPRRMLEPDRDVEESKMTITLRLDERVTKF